MPRHVTPLDFLVLRSTSLGGWRAALRFYQRTRSRPDTPATRENGRTHGVAVTRDGLVVVFAQTRPAVLLYSPDGTLEDAWGEQFPGAHGLTLVEEDGHEFLWLTDPDIGAVVKTTLSGDIVMAVNPPEVSPAEHYKPTSVAVHPRSRDVYVATGTARTSSGATGRRAPFWESGPASRAPGVSRARERPRQPVSEPCSLEA